MKTLIQEPEKFKYHNKLYFYTVRFLLERISWLVEDVQHLIIERPGKCELVFFKYSFNEIR
jgi:hypothetical protein